MKILGLHDGHGASIAALVDGQIMKSFEEERFPRLKGDSGFPKFSYRFSQGSVWRQPLWYQMT